MSAETPTPRTDVLVAERAGYGGHPWEKLENLARELELCCGNIELDYPNWRGKFPTIVEAVRCHTANQDAVISNCRAQIERLLSDLAVAREQLAARYDEIHTLCNDWAEDYTHAQNVVRKYDPSANVEGDEFGVPGIGDLLDMLDGVIAGKDAENKLLNARTMLAEEAGYAAEATLTQERTSRECVVTLAHEMQHRAEARVREVERERDAKVKAAEVLSNVYFDIAEAVVGTEEVRRQREERLALRAADAGQMLTRENAGLRADLREMARAILDMQDSLMTIRPFSAPFPHVFRESTVASARRHAPDHADEP